MPAPTEEQVLTRTLELLDDASKINKHIKIQKWFLAFIAIAAAVTIFIGRKYACLPSSWLIIISFFGGMSFMGLVYIHQAQSQFGLLKPYINVAAIKERINAIKT